MENERAKYESLFSINTIRGMSDAKALEHIGSLIDISSDFKAIEGLEKAKRLSLQLIKRRPKSLILAELYYFLANVWSEIRRIKRVGSESIWDWEQEELEKEITFLRQALYEPEFNELMPQRKCQIFTNLGNLFSHIGRYAEAVDYFNEAIALIPIFSMANGNRGYCFYIYAKELDDDGHKLLFLKKAYQDIKLALEYPRLLEGNAQDGFTNVLHHIEHLLGPNYTGKDVSNILNNFELGTSKEEENYRLWCLNNRLFLNPLNELGEYPISARDILHVPSIVTERDDPYFHGYFNQIKQEFIAARFLYYEGLYGNVPHYYDREVLLFNTLDYPAYSVNIEKIRISYRVAYSIFDKIAFFINKYLNLLVPDDKVSFKSIWYDKKDDKLILKSSFSRYENLTMRGLFWLSKDLFENKQGFRNYIEPEAKDLNTIRNRLEHRYLKLHDYLWDGITSIENNPFSWKVDQLSFSIYRKDFEKKTLKLLKLVRSALLYLVLAISREEKIKVEKRKTEAPIVPLLLDIFKDNWKK